VINPLQTQTRNAQGIPAAEFGRIDTGSTFGPSQRANRRRYQLVNMTL
jgi:hypothetical protein